MNKIKGIIALFIAILMLFLVVGCGAKQLAGQVKDGQSKNTSDKNLPEKLSNKDIRILVWTEDVKAEFEEADKIMTEKYGANIDYTMVAWGQTEEKVVTSMTAGEPFDAVYWGPGRMPRWIAKGIVQPIDEYYDLSDPTWSDVLHNMENYKYKGKYYGVCVGPGNPFFLYYNKTMFENNGVKTPREYYKEGNWNWDIIKELAMKLTQDTNGDGVVDQWGLDFAKQDTYILANGADLVDIKEDGSIALTADDPKVIEALQFYQDGIAKFNFMPQKPSAKINFPLGKLAMGVDRLPALVGMIPDIKDEWDIVPFPAGPNGPKNIITGIVDVWGMCSGCKNPDGGATLIYLRKKTVNAAEEKLAEHFNDEQAQLYRDLCKNIKVAKYGGIGQWSNKMNPFWNELKKGTPPMSVVEKYKPIFQEEIDSLIKEASN